MAVRVGWSLYKNCVVLVALLIGGCLSKRPRPLVTTCRIGLMGLMGLIGHIIHSLPGQRTSVRSNALARRARTAAELVSAGGVLLRRGRASRDRVEALGQAVPYPPAR